MATTILTQEFLHSIFEYCNGNLYWKNSKYKSLNGKLAGSINPNGYRQIVINKKTYRKHRIIFFMFYGIFPKLIDHIDGDKLNNKIENLREASVSQNGLNSKLNKKNKAGFKNVYWSKQQKAWRVKFTVAGKQKHIGFFKNLNDAVQASIESRKMYHGEFARHE